MLPDMKADYAEVDAFYDFWFSFQSWREFAHLHEFNIEDSDSRAEKRWMQRENEKKTKAEKKAELLRVQKLVTLAHKLDPRVKAHQAVIDAEKAAVKAAKQLAKKQKREAKAAALAKAEAERAAEQKRVADAAQAERVRKADIAKKRQLFGALLRDKPDLKELNVLDYNLVKHIARLGSHEELTTLLEAFNQGKAPYTQAVAVYGPVAIRVAAVVEGEIARAEESRIAKLVKKRKDQEELKKSDDWPVADKALLTKAMIRYPGGSSERWEKIANMINQQSKTTRKKPLKTKQVIRQYKLMASGIGQGLSDKKPSKATRVAAASNSNAVVAEQKGKVAVKTTIPWTADEQMHLEKALKTFPKSLGKERWTMIAQAVEGKTKKECVARFKEIRALVKAKAAAAAATK
jgi:DnaJ family protein C protein 2